MPRLWLRLYDSSCRFAIRFGSGNASRTTSRVVGRSGFRRKTEEEMLDLVYIFVGVIFFVGCWALAKACDRL